MYAIFTSQSSAQAFTDSVHEQLGDDTSPYHRHGYNAMIWTEPQKHYNEDKWAVAMPPENIPVPEGATKQEGLEGWVEEMREGI